VLLNLISNAADAMRDADAPNGRIWISIAVAASGREATISVRDEGPGIGAGMEQQMFQPFVTTKATGLGMGLSICRSLVEAQGGRLWHEAHHGPGACFRFTLPLARPPQ
jgi:C4-dicarboxylate-specific signal transduction histidine kinase